MPEDFLAILLEQLPQANVVGFGFGEEQKTCIVKAYLEFGEPFYRAVKDRERPGKPYLSHLGLKWDAEGNTRKAITRYTCTPNASVTEMQVRLSESLYGDKIFPVFEIVKGILQQASDKARRKRFLFLDVTEEDSPRSSFDINLYNANLQLREVDMLLQAACRHFSIPEKKFIKVFEPFQSHILGHLAGGRDRQGRDFLTVYFGEDIR